MDILLLWVMDKSWGIYSVFSSACLVMFLYCDCGQSEWEHSISSAVFYSSLISYSCRCVSGHHLMEMALSSECTTQISCISKLPSNRLNLENCINCGVSLTQTLWQPPWFLNPNLTAKYFCDLINKDLLRNQFIIKICLLFTVAFLVVEAMMMYVFKAVLINR